jgi:lysophospholipase L1-like esterase
MAYAKASRAITTILALLAVFVFAGSLAVNIYLLNKVFLYYKSINLLRLDPLEARILADRIPAEQRHNRARTVLLFGDSRIAQWRPEIRLPECVVVNRGISGQTTEQLRMRVEKDVLAHSPDIVVVQAGINDLKNIGLFPESSARIISRCKENLDDIIQSIAARNIPVMVLTIFPTGKPNIIRSLIWSEEIDAAVVKVNNFLKANSGKRIHVMDVNPILGHNRYVRAELKRDMLHINKKGYQRLNEFLEPQLLQELTR